MPRDSEKLKLIHQEQDEDSTFRLLRDEAGNFILEGLARFVVDRKIVTIEQARAWLIMNLMPDGASLLFPEANIQALL